MEIRATPVYEGLPLATTKPVTLKVWDKTLIANLLLLHVKRLKGEMKSPFVRIRVTPDSIIPLQNQGIDTQGLTHFVLEFSE